MIANKDLSKQKISIFLICDKVSKKLENSENSKNAWNCRKFWNQSDCKPLKESNHVCLQKLINKRYNSDYTEILTWIIHKKDMLQK